MRVAVVAEQLLAPVAGGTGRYSGELVAALTRTAAPGDTVSTYIAWHRDTAAARIAGITPTRLMLPRRALSLAWEFGTGPLPRGDVVHAPTLLAPPVRSGRLVVTIHDAVPWTHPQTLTRHGVRWHQRMARVAAARADAVVVPSHAVAEELARVLPTLAASKLHVLSPGVSRALLTDTEPGTNIDAGTGTGTGTGTDRTAEQVRRRLALPDRYLVTLATLEPRKGLDVLIAAVSSLGASCPPLLVVGPTGWGGVDVDHAVRAAGLAPGAVRAMGRLRDDEVSVVLRSALALVAPSRAEGFGLPVLEAMALGTAVIGSQLPAFAEVSDGAALLVPVGDAQRLAEAISQVSTDAGLRAALVAAGRRRAGDFDWDRTANQMWQLYRELAS